MQIEFPSRTPQEGKRLTLFWSVVPRAQDTPQTAWLVILLTVWPGRGLSHLSLICEGASMKPLSAAVGRLWLLGRISGIAALGLALAMPAFAQGTTSPWEKAVNALQLAFTSTIARGLSLVAIVVSGLTFAFGEGGSKRVLAGVLFGVGMAIAAVNFLAWLFPA
jgi:type IV secretory pathway VirB2 component (pilin)